MIWEHFLYLSWLLWYYTEQEIGRRAPGKFGRHKTCLQLSEVISGASLLWALLGFATCCSFCLWKNVPKVSVHGEGWAWIHWRRSGMRKHKAKHQRAQMLLHTLPRAFWHLHVIIKRHGRAMLKTADPSVSFSSKCPKYFSFALQLALDAKRWQALWKEAKLLLQIPTVPIVFMLIPFLCSFSSVLLTKSIRWGWATTQISIFFSHKTYKGHISLPAVARN